MPEPHVLVVDLDGTLISTDLLYESFWSVLSRDFRVATAAFAGLVKGRARLKARLARECELDPSTLPYNETVVELVREWRNKGGRAVLYTASDQRLAQSVADHLGLFDEVCGSDGERNLKGAAKADALRQRFGEDRFDYVGDSRADLPVWRVARRTITVGAGDALKASVEDMGKETSHLDAPRPSIGAYLRALRPHQWLKNILIFLPMIAAHDMSGETWLAALLAFVSFCLVASSVYVLNDLMDLEADRAHPRKKHRPFASGTVPLSHGTAMAPGLLILGILVALAVGRIDFLLVMAAYYGLTIAYSSFFKRKLIIDICTLAGLYTMRIIAGGAATGLTLSVWLLAFSIFFFLSLAAIKRQAELVDSMSSGREQASGRAYMVDDLPIVAMIAIAAGYVAVFVMALYINSPAVQTLYSNPKYLWGVCPILLYWISRLVMIAHRGKMDDDPIVYAIRDRTSLFCGLVVSLIVVAAGLS